MPLDGMFGKHNIPQLNVAMLYSCHSYFYNVTLWQLHIDALVGRLPGKLE